MSDEKNQTFNMGSVQGANVIIGGSQTVHGNITITMGEMTQTIQQGPATNTEKDELARLVKELRSALTTIPAEYESNVKKLIERVDETVKEVSTPGTDPADVKSSADKLQRAADTIQTVLPLAFPIATQIIAQVLRMAGG